MFNGNRKYQKLAEKDGDKEELLKEFREKERKEREKLKEQEEEVKRICRETYARDHKNKNV